MISLSSPDLAKLRLSFAILLTENGTGPTEVLEQYFQKAMQSIQKTTKTTWPKAIENRVWHHVKLNYAAVLEETLAETIRVVVLDEFTDEKILHLYKALLSKNLKEIERHKQDFACVCEEHLEVIAFKVHQKVISIKRKWIPELLKTLQQEGVVFSTR